MHRSATKQRIVEPDQEFHGKKQIEEEPGEKHNRSQTLSPARNNGQILDEGLHENEENGGGNHSF